MNKIFKFDANEYSRILQISQSALRKRRLSGKLEGLFIEDKGKYFYALPRPIKGRGTFLKQKSLARKRRRNVPSHLTRYPNTKFQTENDIKQLARIKKLLREEEIEHITPDIIAIAKERHQKELDKKLNDPFMANENARAKKRHDDMLIEQDRIECGDYSFRNRRSAPYDITEPDGPGSVEVPILELSPGDSNIEQQPISKVRESILRLEIEALKKNK